MKRTTLTLFFVAALCAAAPSASAQSFGEVANATLDAIRESREQAAAETDVRAIFAKAKAAADEDDKLNLCGFYTGMSAADARTLVGYYALRDGEWSIEGDPVYKIYLSLKGVRRVTKGGNTFDELAQAVANRVGSLKQNWETKVYGLKTIDGISVTMSESSGFSIFDTDAKVASERKAREEWEATREEWKATERKEKEEREAAVRKVREDREASSYKIWRERDEIERATRDEILSWVTELKIIIVSDSVEIQLQSVPGNLWFGITEVTQAQWEAVMGENPSAFQRPNNPVEQVSWNDCQKFLRKLNTLPAVKETGLTFRLPTELEWELACRAGAMGDYCRLADGTEITGGTLGLVAWFDDISNSETHPVGQKLSNAFGLYDMLGNVWEWTSTKEGAFCIYRGGSWYDSLADDKSSSRDWKKPSDLGFNIGFRLCASGKAN